MVGGLRIRSQEARGDSLYSGTLNMGPSLQSDRGARGQEGKGRTSTVQADTGRFLPGVGCSQLRGESEGEEKLQNSSRP